MPMRLGDLDGLMVLYDKIGKPILADGEVLLAQRTAEALALYRGRRTKGEPLIHSGQGDTLVVLTDRRLLVLVDPSLHAARRVLHLPGAESYTLGRELFTVIQGRGRYYLDIPWYELPKVSVPAKRRGTVRIPVAPEGGGPHLLLVDRETAGWIERIWWEAIGPGHGNREF
jgi:hypothetical protein